MRRHWRDRVRVQHRASRLTQGVFVVGDSTRPRSNVSELAIGGDGVRARGERTHAWTANQDIAPVNFEKNGNTIDSKIDSDFCPR